MEAPILFLLKSIAVSGLLTLWYLLGLRNRPLHQYNRFFLLSILFLSLTIPLLHFQVFNIPHAVSSRFAPTALLLQPQDNLSAAAPALTQPIQTRLDWLAIVGVIAVGISLILLSILLIRILKVRRMCSRYAVTRVEGINLVLTDSPRAPFTFLRYLFWNSSLPIQDEIGQLIFRHELTHIEQGHTYDKLACQILTCIFWFNPFYWVIQKELNLVHEFVADEHAVANHDTETFAMMLLRTYNNGSYLMPEHYFFSSTIKRRLAMLQNAQIPSYAALRRFIAVPVIAGTILLFSFSAREDSATAGQSPHADSTTNVSEETQLVRLLEKDELINEVKGFYLEKNQKTLSIDGTQLPDDVAAKYISGINKDVIKVRVYSFADRQRQHPDATFLQLLLPVMFSSPCVDYKTEKKPGC